MSDMADVRVSSNGDNPAYSYKASLVGAAFEFRLRPDGLEWRKGRREGRMPYGRIVRVRLSFRPMTMQMRRFVTEIWPADGPKLSIASTTWRSLVGAVGAGRSVWRVHPRAAPTLG